MAQPEIIFGEVRWVRLQGSWPGGAQYSRYSRYCTITDKIKEFASEGGGGLQ